MKIVPIIALFALVALLSPVSVRAAESTACLEPTLWWGAVNTTDCWLNAPFSPGQITNCDQLDPDEEADCVELCTNCFSYCNAQCTAPTTIFENNSPDLVAGCSCVQGSPESGANTITVAAAAAAAAAAMAHQGL